MKTNDDLLDKLQESIENLDNLTDEEIPEQKPFTGRRKVRRSSNGKWREVNPELLEKIFSSNLSNSETRIILYFIWSMTSHTTRNFVITSKKNIEQRTNLSQSQVSKSIDSLIKKHVIIHDSEDKNKYHFNPQFDIWCN